MTETPANSGPCDICGVTTNRWIKEGGELSPKGRLIGYRRVNRCPTCRIATSTCSTLHRYRSDLLEGRDGRLKEHRARMHELQEEIQLAHKEYARYGLRKYLDQYRWPMNRMVDVGVKPTIRQQVAKLRKRLREARKEINEITPLLKKEELDLAAIIRATADGDGEYRLAEVASGAREVPIPRWDKRPSFDHPAKEVIG